MPQPLSNRPGSGPLLPPTPAPTAPPTNVAPPAPQAPLTLGAGLDAMTMSAGSIGLAAGQLGAGLSATPSPSDIDSAFGDLANLGLPGVGTIASTIGAAGDLFSAGQSLFNNLAGQLQQSWASFTAKINPINLHGANIGLADRLKRTEASAEHNIQARQQPGSPYQHAYAALSPSDKAHFDHLMQALGGQDPASVVARDALQHMLTVQSGPGSLLNGPGGKNADGQTLLASLDALAATPAVKGGPNPQMLLRAVVREVQDPSWINQGNFNSCGAGSAQTLMAFEDPAEYARLAKGLATGSGAVATRGGMRLERAADWASPDASGRRSITGALMEPAFMHGMEYLRTHLGVGPGYTNTNGGDGQSVFGKALPGAAPDDQANLLANLRGRPYDMTIGTNPNRPWRDAGPGRAMTVAMNFTDDGPGVSFHYVSITGYTPASGNQPARVQIYDTAMGMARSITEAELESHLIASSYPSGQKAG